MVDELSVSAYITAALLELGQLLTVRPSPAVPGEGPAGCGGDQGAVGGSGEAGGQLYWQGEPSSYGNEAPSAEAITAYVLLAYLSLPNVSAADMTTAAQIVRWLSKQQNLYKASTQLEKQPLVKRLEVQKDQVTLYLDQLTEEAESFTFSLEQDFPVKNLRAAPVRLYDYETAELYHPHTGTVSVHLSDLNETVRVSVRLERGDGPSAITLLEREVREPRLHENVRFQVPAPSGGQQEVAELHVSIRGDALQFSERKKVLLRALQPRTFVQTDKAVYKPEQTVKFRIVSLDKDFVPSTQKLPLVTVQVSLCLSSLLLFLSGSSEGTRGCSVVGIPEESGL
ncbi:hypothetical protein KIL84_002359 [Mauremys mutica]|uniref:Alpha-macroglobulin receptor-binding domain-containing protein n=1 Tax=Mauremys mutica TaxID=74926 RepID=A0A9D3X818_9SAUR|nr:hypothetical protein KIL84_002359 [Mauremys mutica]